MSLLQEIQAALMEEGRDIGPIFLKLRFLAERLGSVQLEEWVKHESEGYPNGVPLPDYREIAIFYTGSFSGVMGSGIRNAPIPSYLIQKHAGTDWLTYKMRASVAAIDDLIASSTNSEGGRLQINSADLILLLQGHVYEDLACNSVVGTVSQASLAEIQHVVRSRILELTLALEKQIPAAAEITLGPASARTDDEEARTATQITNQVIHGNVTTISSIGDGAQIHVEVGERDTGTFCQALIDAGLPVGDARELAEIVNAEEAESADRPWGANAQAWLAKNIGKAASGTWKIGLKVATDVLTEAAMKFYGFK